MVKDCSVLFRFVRWPFYVFKKNWKTTDGRQQTTAITESSGYFYYSKNWNCFSLSSLNFWVVSIKCCLLLLLSFAVASAATMVVALVAVPLWGSRGLNTVFPLKYTYTTLYTQFNFIPYEQSKSVIFIIMWRPTCCNFYMVVVIRLIPDFIWQKMLDTSAVVSSG